MPRVSPRKCVFPALILFLLSYLGLMEYERRVVNYDIQLEKADHNLRRILGSRNTIDLVIPGKSTLLMQPHIPKIGFQNLGADILAVIVVVSTAENKRGRDILRSTLGTSLAAASEEEKVVAGVHGPKCKVRGRIKMVFFTGVEIEGLLPRDLEEESRLHGDLIVDNFLDTYNNLTLKSMRLLKYFNAVCPHTRYVIKMDDDVYVNLQTLTSYLESQCFKDDSIHSKTSDLIAGYKVSQMRIEDDPYHRHFVPKWLWSEETYPDYVYGFFYILGNGARKKIYEEALRTPLIHIEDLFITGIVGGRRLGLPVQKIPSIVTWHRFGSLFISGCDFENFVSVHSFTEFQRICMHEIFNEPHYQCGRILPIIFYC